MDIITSKDNIRVKHIKSLNDKKNRDFNNEFYIEGIKVISEILDLEDINIKYIAYSYDILSKLNGGNNLLAKLNILEDILTYDISSNIFNSITDTVTTQGILAVISKEEVNIQDMLLTDILIIDRVQDAGNLGSIIRSAVAFGIKNIICNKGCVDCYSPKVIRSTMSNILKVNIKYFQDLDYINTLKKNNFKIVATSLNTNNNIEVINDYKKIALVVGNESNGIDEKLINISDELIKINMTNMTESLNVSVATSIILHERFKKMYKQ